MSEKKHTPGPWNVGVTSDAGEVDIIAADGWFVAVACDSAGDGDTETNAHLIAAAPEMLDLLVESQTSIGGDWRERRDAAIKKARGES